MFLFFLFKEEKSIILEEFLMIDLLIQNPTMQYEIIAVVLTGVAYLFKNPSD